MPREEISAIELCKEKDCPMHPDYEGAGAKLNSRGSLAIIAGSYKINLVCLFCTRAIKSDMKKDAKIVLLKKELRQK